MRKRFHGLKKPKPRQDWSKWTLYNISRMTLPNASSKTFFQQKWAAKSVTRAYHGEQIREGQWTRMFDRRLPAVVPMDYRRLARTDGSEQAAGRGSGLDLMAKKDEDGEEGRDGRRRSPPKTPYMHMTYHPTERRLDTAIFRSLFASSTRQARQFVVHGFVKVNGKKMEYPGYLLNPGDMFSVEPERVLFATGARKHRKSSPDTLQGAIAEQNDLVVDDDASDLLEEGESSETTESVETKDKEAASEEKKAEEKKVEDPKKMIQTLIKRAKSIMSDSKEVLSAKRKQELRSFSQTAKKTLSQIRGTKISQNQPLSETIEGLEETLNSISTRIPGASTTPTLDAAAEASPASTDAAASTTTTPPKKPESSNPQSQEQSGKEDAYRARKDAELLHAALLRAEANPIDVRKPYATPWRPREYMSAFAFIPRYLEVNQKICSAVYLRHPVARPGLAEVPTPFHAETSALAFNWYLRRR